MHATKEGATMATQEAIDQLQAAIAAEKAADQLMVRNEIRAAVGWLVNILDSTGEEWVADMTTLEALAGAGDWAHDNWGDYQDEARTRVTQRKVG